MRWAVVLVGTLCSLLTTVWEWYHSRLLLSASVWKPLLSGIYKHGHTADAMQLWLLPLGAVFLLCWWHVVHFRSRYPLWLVFLAWALPQFLSIGGDMLNYAEQGWMLLHGADPTLVPAGTVPGPFRHWSGVWHGTTVGYPVLALALAAMAVAFGSATAGGTLFFLHLWAFLGLGLIGWALPRVARLAGFEGRWVFAVVLLNPMVLEFQLGQGHHDTLAAGIGLLGVWAWFRVPGRSNRWVISIVLLGIAAAVKQPALICPLVAAGVLQLNRPAPSHGLPWAGDPEPDGPQRLRAAWAALRATGPLWIGPVVAVFFLPWVVGWGTGWLTATGKPGPGSLTIPRIIQVAVDVQRVRHHLHIMDTGALFTWFTVAAVLLFLVCIFRGRVYVWTSVVWIGLAITFLLGTAYFPWYGIWVLVPLMLSPTPRAGKAGLVTLMVASSTFPIFHAPGVLWAYAMAWGAALVAGAGAWWITRRH